MRNALWVVIIIGMTLAAASAQTPLPTEPATSPAECAENPFKPGCGPIVITPGAPGTGLKPQGGGAGIDAKGLRPMDRPSFDRGSLRLPKGID